MDFDTVTARFEVAHSDFVVKNFTAESDRRSPIDFVAFNLECGHQRFPHLTYFVVMLVFACYEFGATSMT